MPCGGIFPSELSIIGRLATGQCWHCGKDGADHFCEEWDCFLHATCVPLFLETDEGRGVVSHHHEVMIRV